ncbi:MAG: flagellar motor protein MotB [Rickettsiales bacterium]|nr:hypothetical protein [Pseudomonadota bacterium]MDA0965504.1 hypothetical protein [Pseudomonadota bacterium]MDG4542828.1 flagellar motor protein MotB [Rickettsiales bacterium]MDG4544724.1 flagellar motor protein MotB [Rickettsiales bacterium]MDG4546846.1 flagellar motor protein MotB [Rickettsiales bacterium]
MTQNNEHFLHEFKTEETTSNNNWMMTFADLLSLLLVFFILIYATTSIKKGQWDKLRESMGESFKAAKVIEKKLVTNLHATKITINKGTDIDYLEAVIESKIKDDAFLKNNIKLEKDANSLIIKINGPNLFEGNSPVLTEDSRVLLFIIGDALQRVKNRIEVFGYINENDESKHTDSLKLALSRAVKLASGMRDAGNLSKLEAMVKNEKPSGLDDKSLNRIDIIVRPYINSPD